MAEQQQVTEIIGDRILVEKIVKEDVTSSGIVMVSGSNTDLIMEGTVRSWGNKLKSAFVDLGDIVMFPKYAYTPIKIDGEELGIIEAADVYAVQHKTNKTTE